MRRVLYRQESFDFFQIRTVILGNFESYLSLLNFPEFMTLSVSKNALSAPVLTCPSWVLGCCAASTKLPRRIKFIFYTPRPHFLTLIWVWEYFYSCWLCLNNSEMVNTVIVVFWTFSKFSLETLVPNLASLTCPSLQILGKTQTGVFPISGFLVNHL